MLENFGLKVNASMRQSYGAQGLSVYQAVTLASIVQREAVLSEERPVMVRDSVDLTPYIREDIVLALPTHPLCRKDCPGLPGMAKQTLRTADTSTSSGTSSPWDELNKLKLKS